MEKKVKHRKIKFNRNPIDPGRGEWWPKLDDITEDDEFILTHTRNLWSTDLSPEEIKADTFDNWTFSNFFNLMLKIYGLGRVFGILLYFTRVSDGKKFTTFRAYEPRKARYYTNCQIEEDIFKVVRVEPKGK